MGVLQFACKVVPQGRPFVCKMINLLCIPTKPFHHVRLNKEFLSDLLWWHSFVRIWNGIFLLRLSIRLILLANIFTDASGNFGCGAVWGLKWIQGEWHQVNIMTKELVPVVLACTTWGRQWSGKHIHLHIDNMAVVEVLKKGSSKEPSSIVMHLLRCLSFVSHTPHSISLVLVTFWPMISLAISYPHSLHRKSQFSQIFGPFLCRTDQTGPRQSGGGFSQILFTRSSLLFSKMLLLWPEALLYLLFII